MASKNKPSRKAPKDEQVPSADAQQDEAEAVAGDAVEAQAPQEIEAEAPQTVSDESTVAQADASRAIADEAPSATAEAPQDTEVAAASAQAEAMAPPAEPEATSAEGREPESEAAAAAVEASADASEGDDEQDGADDGAERQPPAKPSVPGAHLEVDIVPEGVDPLGRGQEYEDPYALEEEYLAQPETDDQAEEEREEVLSQPIASAAIDLAAGARYRATGKRKTAIARVTLRPGSGAYVINGRPLEEHFPRSTLQRNIRQPLEMVGYEERMDVIARLHGGGISAQAGALRHGVSRALLEADPNLRSELKRRGFLTRDSRAKERKKAGLKKARKRPQFSKR